MSKKLLFIFNPRSGKGKIKNSLFGIIDCFSSKGYDTTVYPTKRVNDCKEKIASCAAEYNIVVVAGGDGTLNEAVNGMMELNECDRVPIGYIPAGTTNDFAATNNISSSPVTAAKAIMQNGCIPYDIGLLNNKRFIYVAGFGAFTNVSYSAPQTNKNILGSAAYILEGIKSLPKIKGIDVKIKADDAEEQTFNASHVLIMNSTSVAGFHFGEFYDINTNDGLFEIVVIDNSINLLDIPILLNKIKNGETNMQGITIITASSAVIKTNEPVKWTLDGEYGGESDYAEFNVAHNAVSFFISDEQ